MNTEQYLQAGRVHTEKDKKIDWDTVKYLQSQVNAHMWWLTNVVGYCKDTNQARMNRNLQGATMEIPDMVLLVKDHKRWSPDSKDPIPTRPVMSGTRGINSHLSEWLSEILEPIALNMASAEVNSTEEALAKIDQLNSCLDTDKTLDRLDPLTNISIVTDHELRPETAREKINRTETEVFKFSGDDNYKLNTIATAQGQDDYVMKNEMNKISEEGHLIEDILGWRLERRK